MSTALMGFVAVQQVSAVTIVNTLDAESVTGGLRVMDGKNGKDGMDGQDGQDGKPGKDGSAGQDGKSVTNGKVSAFMSVKSWVDGELVVDSSHVLSPEESSVPTPFTNTTIATASPEVGDSAVDIRVDEEVKAQGEPYQHISELITTIRVIFASYVSKLF